MFLCLLQLNIKFFSLDIFFCGEKIIFFLFANPQSWISNPRFYWLSDSCTQFQKDNMKNLDKAFNVKDNSKTKSLLAKASHD